MTWNSRLAILVILSAQLSLAGDHSNWIRLMEEANQFEESGALDKAEFALRAALREAESPRRENLAYVATLNNLGGLFLERGQFLEAEVFLIRAWSELEKTPGSQQEFRLRVGGALSSLWLATGKESRAEALVLSLLPDEGATLNVDAAALLGNLGVALAHKRAFYGASAKLQIVVNALEGMTDPRACEVKAIALSNLGGIAMAEGSSAARGFYKEALESLNRIPNPSPSVLAPIMAGYARLLFKSNDLRESVAMYSQAINLMESRLGTVNELYGTLLQELSSTLIKIGHHPEARELRKRSKKILAQVRQDNVLGQTIDVTTLVFEGRSKGRR